jgi:hypothetical protein
MESEEGSEKKQIFGKECERQEQQPQQMKGAE